MSPTTARPASPAAAPTGQDLRPVLRERQEPRTSDLVFDELFSAIRDLRLMPGKQLSETALARQLHVSRTPVREAIARLGDAGLVQVVPQVGTLVARIRMTDVEEARFVRENLEVAALDLVCDLPERNVSGLRAILASQEDAYLRHDLDDFFAADEELHMGIFALAGYPGAWQAVRRKKIQLDRLRRLTLPESSTVRELIDEHIAIVDALASGTAEAGRPLVRAHARRALLRAPELVQAHPDYFTESGPQETDA